MHYYIAKLLKNVERTDVQYMSTLLKADPSTSENHKINQKKKLNLFSLIDYVIFNPTHFSIHI